MAEDKTSILLSDISIEGDLIEKDRIILDGKVNGDISANEVESHPNSSITGNITAKKTTLGGKHKGNVNSDSIRLKKTADVEGVLSQKTLSVEEGATLKVKTETFK